MTVRQLKRKIRRAIRRGFSAMAHALAILALLAWMVSAAMLDSASYIPPIVNLASMLYLIFFLIKFDYWD